MSEKEPTDEVGLLYEIYQWLLLNVDHIVAASNYTISAFMFGLGSLVLYYIFRAKFSGQTDILYMMWGIVFEAYGWCIHRFYWGQWRTARLYKDEEAQQWFVDHAYLALIPSVMVIIGLVLIIGPAISWVIQTKKRWTVYAVTFGFAVSIWWFAYWALEEGFRREREEKLLYHAK